MTNNNALVAAYLAAKAQEEAAAAAVKAARDAILDTGFALLEGDAVALEVSLSDRATIDTAAVKRIMGEHTPMKTSTVTTIRIKPILKAAA